MRTRELTKLSNLFDKYKQRLMAPEASVINAFVEVVEDVLGLKLSKDKVSYTPATKVLSVNVALLRSEIKLHEAELLNHLKGRLGEKNAPTKII